MSKIPLTHVNIIKLLGIESLPIDQRQEIVMSAVELVETRAMNKALKTLGNDKKEEFSKILETQDSEALEKFFQENNINYMAIIEEEVGKIKQELLSVSE